MSLLTLRHISKHVLLPDDTRLDILRDISLTVESGDHLAIVGRSGSGKTTLLNLLGLLDTPSTGEIEFDGASTAQLRRGRMDRLRGRNIGFVFQQFNLLSGRTALENVMMPLGYASGAAFWNRRKLAEDMLDRVGLSGRLDQYPDRLSGGEQQRVAIARALVRRPRLILADEPTGALDVDTGTEVMNLLDEVAAESESALVTITHDLHVASLARRHYRLDQGALAPIDLAAAFSRSTLVSEEVSS